eukprot:SAG22_NODE_6_length_41368_cov_49.702222_3_plen_230_part_00
MSRPVLTAQASAVLGCSTSLAPPGCWRAHEWSSSWCYSRSLGQCFLHIERRRRLADDGSVCVHCAGLEGFVSSVLVFAEVFFFFIFFFIFFFYYYFSVLVFAEVFFFFFFFFIFFFIIISVFSFLQKYFFFYIFFFIIISGSYDVRLQPTGLPASSYTPSKRHCRLGRSHSSNEQLKTTKSSSSPTVPTATSAASSCRVAISSRPGGPNCASRAWKKPTESSVDATIVT